MFFVLIGVVALLGVLAVVILIYGNNKLQSQSDTLTELRLEDRLLEEQQTALTRAKADIETYSELENVAKSVVPQDKDQARAVREIIQLAGENGIPIRSITFPASNLGSQPTSRGGGTPSSGASQNPALTQAKPVDDIPGVYSLEMNILPPDGAPIQYNQFIQFLESLENNRRTASVSRVRIDPARSEDGAQSGFITFRLTINIYIKP